MAAKVENEQEAPGGAGLTARKLRAQQNARTAAEAEAKSAASAPKHPQGAWSNAAAAAGDGAEADGGSAGGAAAEVAPLPEDDGQKLRREKALRLAKAAPALAQAKRNNVAKQRILGLLNKMDSETLAAFGSEVGVEKGPAEFTALRTTVIKKLEEREGTWAEIAPDVATIASKFAKTA
ncbi:unnamed protein product [Ectocarpus sp. 4 AP-2014]